MFLPPPIGPQRQTNIPWLDLQSALIAKPCLDIISCVVLGDVVKVHMADNEGRIIKHQTAATSTKTLKDTRSLNLAVPASRLALGKVEELLGITGNY